MMLARLVTRLAAIATLVAAPTPAAAQPGGDDMATLAAYRLTEASLDQFDRATRAMIAAAQDPAVRRQVAAMSDDDDEGDPSIAEIAARIDRVPAMRRAITGAGMTSRGYVTFQLSLFQAAMAVALLEMQGASGELPEGTPPQNVAFARKHKQRIEAMGRELRQLQGDDDDDDDADDDPPARR